MVFSSAPWPEIEGIDEWNRNIQESYSPTIFIPMEPRLIDARLSLDSAEFSREGYLFIFFSRQFFFFGSWFYAFLFL